MCTDSGLPIVQYWHSEPIPDYISDLLATFGEQNPDLLHLVFSERSDTEFIAERFSKRELRAFRACAVPAMQADYFRYCAVLTLGGIFGDADARCIGRIRPLIPAVGSGQLFRRPGGPVINALFGFGSPRHRFLKLVLEIVTANIEQRLCNRVYYTTGPPIFETLHLLHRLGSFDAVIEQNKGRVSEEFVRFYCEVIGEHSRVGNAMEGIEVSPLQKQDAYIRGPGMPLPYKKTDTHWTNLEQEIFR